MDPLIDALRALAINIALLKGDATALHLLEAKPFRCLSITAFAEARGEGRRGMALVVQSIVNRREITGRTGCAIAERSYDGYKAWHGRNPARVDRENWAEAQLITLNVLMGEFDLGNCQAVTHFLNPSQVRRMPSWASNKNRICKVGQHVAYKVANI